MSKERKYSGSTNIAAIDVFLEAIKDLDSDQREKVRKMLKAFVLAGAVGSLVIFYYRIRVGIDKDGTTTITAEKTE